MFPTKINFLLKKRQSINSSILKCPKLKTSTNAEPFLNGTSATYVENIYAAWLNDPCSVHKSWDVYFKNVNLGNSPGKAYTSPPTLGFETGLQNFQKSIVEPRNKFVEVGSQIIDDHLTVQNIIRSYQVRGHMAAKLDPLGIKSYGDSAKHIVYRRYLGTYREPDMDKIFQLPHSTYIGGNETELPFREILKRLEDSYCKSIGVDFMFINSLSKCDWIRSNFEKPGVVALSADEKRLTLKRLIRSTQFEAYLAKKWSSEKRFGLEGCEVLIPAMKTVMDESSALGVDSFIIGMPHRGRLNVLANVCRKPLPEIFCQFDSSLEAADEGTGDVKYHLGMSHRRINRQTGKEINIAVCANPSHLEAVDPVALGKTRSEQFYRGDTEGKSVMSIQLHGDAAFSGQGVVFETMHLSDLPSYSTKGSIHIVVNNQVGFTTDPRMARSSPHCTDVAKVTNCLILHVNANDPEAVVHVSKVASKWRAKFGKDVVIDLVCYRRFGHNETDEPMFTQPLMYKRIHKMDTVLKKYAAQLLSEGVITNAELEAEKAKYEAVCDEAYAEAKTQTVTYNRAWLDSPWHGFFESRDPMLLPPTGIDDADMAHIGHVVSSYPSDFEIHSGLKRVMKEREELIDKRQANWALGELFAYGSLLKAGHHVRISGQDVERGTFSHRHAVLHHQNIDQSVHIPLNNVFEGQAPFTICNSSLSEYAVMGFELGYSLTNPNSLVIWEAQFGDFSNTAQCIIDQFLSGGQQKWVRQSNLVLLLPHGYEGMGPEHSSGRLERFLQMSNDSDSFIPNFTSNFHLQQLYDCNWIIANCTTPANMFHILRRQIIAPFRKPLIVFTPKSLLRLPEARSSFDDMLPGTAFLPFISESGPATSNAENVKKIILCSGKVYYDLAKQVQTAGLSAEIAIARIEQLTPLPYDLLKAEIERYPNAVIQWVQEEHKNMGAWSYVKPRIEHLIQLHIPDRLYKTLLYAGRPASAATATGRKATHLMEASQYLKSAMTIV